MAASDAEGSRGTRIAMLGSGTGAACELLTVGFAVGVVSSTSRLDTHVLPQHTERILLWLATDTAGITKRTMIKVTREKAAPKPPPISAVLAFSIRKFGRTPCSVTRGVTRSVTRCLVVPPAV